MAVRIAVIGAGCAGLGAATELVGQKEVAVDVTLIDPNDWIGGRARTHADPALPVDLGPQFIQDPEVNPWRVILEQMPGYDLKKIAPISPDGAYRIQGEKDAWTTVDSTKAIDQANALLDKGYGIATGFRNAAILTSGEAAVVKDQEGIRLSFGSSGLGAIAESAEPWQYVASDRDRQGEYPSAGNIYVPGGLGNLVGLYGKKLLTENELILHLRKGIVVAVHQGPKEIVITTGDEAELEADFCIVTIPCAAVQEIRFSPSLPGARIRADSFIRLGSYKKVAFKPHAFPKGEGESDQIRELMEYYIYDKKLDGVWQYFRLPTDPSILICVAAGEFAARLDEEKDGDVVHWVTGLLQSAYKDGNFTAKDGKVVVTNWSRTATIGGAYSYTRVDEKLDRDNPVPLEARLEIAKPHGRIHFAGEATWVDAYGTIHGAFRSGLRAAREILALIRPI
jgi:monoamine oxidase